MKHSKNIYFTFFLLCCLPMSLYANSQEHPSSVYSSTETFVGSTDYTYRVVNESNSAVITSVTVGYDYFHGVPELKTEPVEIYSPQGWDGKLVFTEESLEYEVKWTSKSSSYDIQPENTLIGFGFKVPNEQIEQIFMTPHFTLIFGDSTVASKLVQIDDNPTPVDVTPPVLSVSLSPSEIWPPNKKMIEVIATINVHDNEDQNPVVVLDSIKCDDCDALDTNIQSADYGTDDRIFEVKADRLGKRKEGRVYEIIYTATDHSGNKSTVTSTVSIPHDQRN